MTSATDIITYIGIPLAVLGVLPILYTFALSILTQRRIRALLISHGHKPHTTRNSQEGFVLRASPMTSLIEVEMPRYTIAPVERGEERYWEVSSEGYTHTHGHGVHIHGHSEGHGVERVESTLSMLEEGRVRGFLRGGSWRTFHWKRLVVGRKLYRIQYEDELREPPAEIEFADLVNFLMDWGAELDEMGWEKLRSGGLWTPAGTVLLKVGDHTDSDVESKNSVGGGGHGDWVLRTSMPDDSDGILTLCIRWPHARNMGSLRDVTSLPPGWGRLRKPAEVDVDEQTDNEKKTLLATITSLVETNKHLHNTTSLRFHLESGLISKVHPECHGKETGTMLNITSLSKTTQGLEWFTSATSALLTLTKTPTQLWGFEPHADLVAFTRKDTIPCGVLVLLEMLSPDLAPHWDSAADAQTEDRNMATRHHKRFQARLQAERLEAAMPPEQARVHKLNREMEERRAEAEHSMQFMANKRVREQKRVQDAMVSPRMSCKTVAEACLGWLVERGVVEVGTTLVEVVERVLYLLVLQAQRLDHVGEGEGDVNGEVMILRVLEEWVAWSVAGGMKKDQFEMLERWKTEFCYAACLVAVVCEAGSVATGKGKASVDMLECLRLWRKIRLG